MNWNDLQRDLARGKLATVYTFSGKETFLKEKALGQIRSMVLPAGFEVLNETRLEDATFRQIREVAETFPVMSDRRLLTVVDWKPAFEGDSDITKQEVEALERWLQAPPESCITIFLMNKEPDGRRKATSLLKKSTAYVEFNQVSMAELEALSAERLADQGKTIDSKNLEYLASLVNQDLVAIMSELDKLSAYTGVRKRIEKADIDAVTPPSLEYSIYRIADFLLKHDLAKAQRMVNGLIEGGENHAGILAVLSYQYRILLHMRLQLDSGVPLKQIQDTLKISSFAARQNASTCKLATAERLQRAYHDCLETDAGIKQGQLNDKKALALLLIRLAA